MSDRLPVSEHSPITHEQIADNLRLIYAHIYKHPDVAERMCETLREWVVRSGPDRGAVSPDALDELRNAAEEAGVALNDLEPGSARVLRLQAALDRTDHQRGAVDA